MAGEDWVIRLIRDILFRDIMAMLLVGFGYLMTFIKTYGLGAVGFTMILSVLAMQANIVLEYAMRAIYPDTHETLPLELTMINLIDTELSAATLLISFGAVIGRASPLQVLIMMISQAIIYSFNKVFGYIDAEDVGGSVTIHLVGVLWTGRKLRPWASRKEY